MAKIATKSADGLVKILDTSTGVELYIGKGANWRITEGVEYSTLYYYDAPQVTIYADTDLAPGNSIFGATTPSALSVAIISGSIDASSGGGGGGGSGGTFSVNPPDIAAGIGLTTIESRLLDIKNELIASKSIGDLLLQDSASVPNYYVRQEIYNDTTGTSTVNIRNLDGSAASPAPTLPLLPVKANGNQIEESYYNALAVSAGVSIGDQITLVRVLDSGSGSELARTYFNASTGLSVAVISLANLKAIPDRSLEVMESLLAKRGVFSRLVYNSTATTLYTEINDNGTYTYYDSTGALATPTLPIQWYTPRNRFQQNKFIALTTSSLGYWVPGDILQENQDEQRGVQSVFVRNMTNAAAMPNLVSGSPGYPNLSTDAAPIETGLIAKNKFVTATVNGGVTALDVQVQNQGQIVAAGSLPPALGGTAQLVTLDVNSSPVAIKAAFDSGVTNPQTVRTVTANNSPNVTALTSILTKMGDGTELVTAPIPTSRTIVTNATGVLNDVYTSPTFTETVGQAFRPFVKVRSSTACNAWLHVEASTDGTNFEKVADSHYYALSVGNVLENYVFKLPAIPLAAGGKWRFKVEQDTATNPLTIDATVVNYLESGGFTSISQYDINAETRGLYEPGILVTSSGLSVKNVDKPALFMGDTYNVIGNGTTISQTYALGNDNGVSTQTSDSANSYSISARLKTGVGAAVKFFVEAKTRTSTWSIFAESPVITAIDAVWNSPILPVKRGEVRVRTVSSNATASVIDFNVIAYSGSAVHNATVTAGSALALPVDNALVVTLREPKVNQTLGSAGYGFITNGTINAQVKASAPIATDEGLVVRVAASDQTIGNVNQTLATAGFGKITDGTNVGVITATTPIGTTNALVTVDSPNSAQFTSLTPSVAASRAIVGAARYVVTAPTLTDLQQNSLRLDNRGGLIVSQDKLTTQIGQINPAADTALTSGKKVYRVVVTNNSAAVAFLQFHNTALAIATGAAPNLGMVFRVPANSTFVLDETTLGTGGELISANTRVGLSSTFETYTAIVSGTLAQVSLNIKLEA
jgi:hypothetical protein